MNTRRKIRIRVTKEEQIEIAKLRVIAALEPLTIEKRKLIIAYVAGRIRMPPGDWLFK